MKAALMALLIVTLLLCAARAQVWIMTPAGQAYGNLSRTPSVCAGVIDASVGCPMPMLGM